jgi:hypothetical protein
MLGPSVSRNETVTKYQLDREDVRKDGSVRYQALLPAANGKRSVFRIDGLTEVEIWNLGQGRVASIRSLPLLGRFDLKALDVYDHSLYFQVDADYRSRHADIVGWPQEKEERISVAQELAANCYRRPNPNAP